MILSLFRKKTLPEPVYAVYRAIVAQSRQPRFYAEWRRARHRHRPLRHDLAAPRAAVPPAALRATPRCASSARRCSTSSSRTWTARCARWAPATSRCPRRSRRWAASSTASCSAIDEALDRDDAAAADRRPRAQRLSAARPRPKRASWPNTSIAEAARLDAQPVEAIVGGRSRSERRHDDPRRRSAARRRDLPHPTTCRSRAARFELARERRRSAQRSPPSSKSATSTAARGRRSPRSRSAAASGSAAGSRPTVVQPCVVTFVPVRQEIDEPIDRVFLPGREKPAPAPARRRSLRRSRRATTRPDYFEGPEVDLSDLILENAGAGHRSLSPGAGRKPSRTCCRRR